MGLLEALEIPSDDEPNQCVTMELNVNVKTLFNNHSFAVPHWGCRREIAQGIPASRC